MEFQEIKSWKNKLIDIVLGLLKPDDKSKVVVNDLNLYDNLIDWYNKIAYIPQKHLLLMTQLRLTLL